MYCTREGIIGVKDINLLPAVSIDVARCHPDGVALAVPQGVERRATVVNSDVDEPFLLLVVLQHKVRAIVAVNAQMESCYIYMRLSAECHFFVLQLMRINYSRGLQILKKKKLTRDSFLQNIVKLDF